MARKVFISYKFNDREVAHNVESFFQTQGGDCDGKPVYVENKIVPQEEEAIKKEIRRVMADCHIVLFVVGRDSHNSPWIEYEAEVARSRSLPMLAVYLPGEEYGLPNVIKDQVTAVKWTQDTLCSALNTVPVANTPR